VGLLATLFQLAVEIQTLNSYSDYAARFKFVMTQPEPEPEL
jgi:hypothetical protein